MFFLFQLWTIHAPAHIYVYICAYIHIHTCILADHIYTHTRIYKYIIYIKCIYDFRYFWHIYFNIVYSINSLILWFVLRNVPMCISQLLCKFGGSKCTSLKVQENLIFISKQTRFPLFGWTLILRNVPEGMPILLELFLMAIVEKIRCAHTPNDRPPVGPHISVRPLIGPQLWWSLDKGGGCKLGTQFWSSNFGVGQGGSIP